MNSDDKEGFSSKSGEHLEFIENALKFDKALVRTLSFLSLCEQANYLTVSKRWNAAMRTAWREDLHTLCLEQLWCSFGPKDAEKVLALMRNFGHINKLSVAYCSHVTDAMLVQMLNSLLPKQKEWPLTSLNVFYCNHVADSFVKYLSDNFPALTELNLGRLPQLTTKAFDYLAKLPNLRKLNMVSNSVTEDTFMMFDDGSSFPALVELDVQNAGKKDLQKYVDELKATRPKLKIVGPEPVRFEVMRKSQKKPQSTS
jgi:hypothetical protein